MKRGREEGEVIDNMTMANCLMLLSRGGGGDPIFDSSSSPTHSSTRVFECKTCNRQFPSFQALGGHRASHKKPRFMEAGGDSNRPQSQLSFPIKPKTHECSICGLEFSIGQALGGHMRRHRAAMNDQNQSSSVLTTSTGPDDSHTPSVAPVVKKSNSRRVFGLDLNLTPLENDLEFRLLGKVLAPPMYMVDCFL